MKYLTVFEIIEIHKIMLDQTGGLQGIRDLGALESACAQPNQTFGGLDLYPELFQKTAALGYSLIMNHPFIDGNKRTGHASMKCFLRSNNFDLYSSKNESEKILLNLAAKILDKDKFFLWVKDRIDRKEQ